MIAMLFPSLKKRLISRSVSAVAFLSTVNTLALSPRQLRWRATLCEASDFPRQGKPTMVTTSGARSWHGCRDDASSVALPMPAIIDVVPSRAPSMMPFLWFAGVA
uniref:Putative secreted protein n=1 Tax=Anopheles triannulatus TaxID=58253 RepID=A0A2M4B668_9DIPT